MGRRHATPDSNGASTAAAAAVEARLAALEPLRDDVRRFVRRLGHGVDTGTLDEVVAETFVVAWRRLDHVPRHDDAARGWLCGVARNVLRNTVRADHRRRRLLERLSAHDRPSAAGPDTAADRLVLAEGWRTLSSADRLVLWRTAVDGWGPSELSTALGCSIVAAKVRVSRARERLRSAITR